MEVPYDWGALQRLTGSVPRSAPGYTTNFYGAREQVERWCVADRLRVMVADGAVLVLRADRDVYRVHHAAQDLSSLSAALALLPAGRYATDLVGEGDILERLCGAYRTGGFADHGFLRRMSRVQMPDSSTPGDATVANREDVPAVAMFLDRLLDPVTEQLPELDELVEAARAGRLLIARRGTTLAGMLMYDVKGQLAHLRFWHVDSDIRGAGVGRGLMTSFLSRCASARRIVLWVIGDNDRSISIYRHYGFKPDGLLDRVMTLTKDQHQ